MSIQSYVNFPGTCREAVAFYASVFGSPAPKIMSYGDLPPDPKFPMDEAARKLVMHTELEIAGGKLLMSDNPPGSPLAVGDNISLIIQTTDGEAIKRWFGALAAGGKVSMPLAPTFWSPLYGYLTDRFGVGWQFSQET